MPILWDRTHNRAGGLRRASPVGSALMMLCLLLVSPVTLVAQEPQPESTESSKYLVAPGDVLSLFVWKEPDLTREVTVGVDGRISVPLLGDVEAAGKTTSQLTDELRERLSRYLSAPSVTLGVNQSNNSFFYVVGRVNKPGEYPLRGHTTFLQALAVAGGFAEWAKTDRVLVVRREGNAEVPLFADYKKLSQGEDLDQNLILQPGDTIVVQ